MAILNGICTTNKQVNIYSGSQITYIGYNPSGTSLVALGNVSGSNPTSISIGNSQVGSDFGLIGGSGGTGTISMGGTGTLTISTSSGTLSINTAGANLNIAPGPNSIPVTIGNVLGTTSVTINSGTGDIAIGRSIAKQILIGNGTSNTYVAIEAGTNGVSIGGNAIAQPIVIGNTTGASSVTINTGSGGIKFPSLTNYGVIGTTSAGLLSSIAASTAGYVLTSNGTGSLPTFQAAAASGIGTLNGNTGSATGSTVTVSGDGTVISTSGSGSTLSITSTAIRTVSTGSGTATASSNAITITGTGPISTSGTSATVTIATTAANTINATSGSATASSNAFSIVGSGTVSTSATGSTVTVTGTPYFAFNNQNSSTVTMAVNNAYLVNNGATLVTLTLPTTAALGDKFQVVGTSSGGWTIAQNSGQTINFGNVNTTTGTGGSLSSTNRYDQISLMCNVANTGFVVTSSVGNITYV